MSILCDDGRIIFDGEAPRCPECDGRGYTIRPKANPNAYGFAMTDMQPCMTYKLREARAQLAAAELARLGPAGLKG